MKSSVFVAVTGTKYYFGTEFIRPGQLIRFRKEPDNPHDQEAIKAEMMPVGKIGYVANSPQTVPKGCRSAGRIYDTFDEHVFGVVRFVVKDTVIVELVHHIEAICVVNMGLNDQFTFGSMSQEIS
ncbi:MAG: DNA-binding protein [Bacillus thermozeamaize]|jgi:hypothetical protein|uniref:DNA-binding protein n=1 Tax=Bacillus thermozeamaize TaxID=230954 RepID=A0A1Y3PMT5_9BACI|nr:MAG: DNA-binding protein [Bacillus thermozeamaize]